MRDDDEMSTLRLLCVNTASLSLSRVELARLIADSRADVACLHGAPSLLRWRSISAGIARRAGMVVVGGGRAGGGNLLMSTLGVDVRAVEEMTLAGTRSTRPHGAVVASMSRRGGAVVVAAVRLTDDVAARRQQAVDLRRAVETIGSNAPPAVISVDGDGPMPPALTAGYVDFGGVLVDERVHAERIERADGHPYVHLELTLSSVS